MAEEIKEILDYVNKFRYNKNIKEINPEDITTTDEIYKLVDCITTLQQEKSDICKNRLAIAIERDRLQQENEKLKAYINYEKQQTKVKGRIIYGDNREELQQRIDKAIEYGNNCLENLKYQEDYICESIDVVSLLKTIHKNYIDMLQGSDENEY